MYIKLDIYRLLSIIVVILIVLYPYINDKNKFRMTLITNGNLNKFIIFLLLLFIILENYLLGILLMILYFIIETEKTFEGFIDYFSS